MEDTRPVQCSSISIICELPEFKRHKKIVGSLELLYKNAGYRRNVEYMRGNRKFSSITIGQTGNDIEGKETNLSTKKKSI